jgi:hypothetical protein
MYTQASLCIAYATKSLSVQQTLKCNSRSQRFAFGKSIVVSEGHACAGEASALVAAQRQLPFSYVWAALESAGLAALLSRDMPASSAQPAGGLEAPASACSRLWGHPPLAAVVLRQPQVTPQKKGYRQPVCFDTLSGVWFPVHGRNWCCRRCMSIYAPRAAHGTDLSPARAQPCLQGAHMLTPYRSKQLVAGRVLFNITLSFADAAGAKFLIMLQIASDGFTGRRFPRQ